MSTEKRLIYADDLKQRFEELAEADEERFGVYIPECFPADDANEIVDSMPTVDAVVLPCKVGDTVWIAGDKFPAEIERITIDADGISFEYVEYDRGRELTEVWDDGSFKPEDIGKTVFLTQEEAERRSDGETD